MAVGKTLAANVVYAHDPVMPGPEYLSSLETLPKVQGATPLGPQSNTLCIELSSCPIWSISNFLTLFLQNWRKSWKTPIAP